MVLIVPLMCCELRRRLAETRCTGSINQTEDPPTPCRFGACSISLLDDDDDNDDDDVACTPWQRASNQARSIQSTNQLRTTLRE